MDATGANRMKASVFHLAFLPVQRIGTDAADETVAVLATLRQFRWPLIRAPNGLLVVLYGEQFGPGVNHMDAPLEPPVRRVEGGDHADSTAMMICSNVEVRTAFL
jgi:hypothetical protein